MRRGKARHKVELQSVTTTSDAAGQRVQTWTTFAKRWVSIRPAKGEEVIESGQFKAKQDYTVRMDRVAELTTKDRVRAVVNGTTHLLEITAIREPELRGKEMYLDCNELLNQ
jgi:SPP1 family predicted phage head-tail adaptor